MAILLDDASSEYLENAAAAVTALPLTMACWFRSDSIALSQALISVGTNGGVARYQLVAAGAYGGDPIQAGSINTGGSSGIASSSSSYSANTWTHAAGVFTTTTSRAAFINGGSKGTNASSIGVTGIDRTTIGARWATTLGAFLSGMVAETAIWSVDLSDAEIAILALGYSPLFVRPESLVAYWPLMGRNDPSIDKVGGFGLAWNNTPVYAEHPRIIYPRRQIFVPDYSVAAGGSFKSAWARGSNVLLQPGIMVGR